MTTNDLTSQTVASTCGRADLERRVMEMNSAWKDHNSESFRQEFFASATRIVGEGMPSSASTNAELVATLQHMFEQAPQVHIELVSSEAAGSAQISWLHWNIVDAQQVTVATMRSLTVWNVEDGRLRIVGDAFSVGVL